MIIDADYIKYLCEKDPPLIGGAIIPGERSEVGISRGLSSCGYDLSLDWDLKKFSNGIISPLGDSLNGSWQKLDGTLGENDSMIYCIDPGDLVIGSSIEYISMPPDIFGIAHLKSCWARTGLGMSLGALQPGWEGKLMLELVNPTKNIIGLISGEGIVHVTFFKLKNNVQDPYWGFAQKQVGTEIRYPKDVINK